MSIVLEYLQLTKFYQEKYGKNTIILYQVGSFFEIYSFIINSVISDETEIEKVAEICNLNIAHKTSYIGEEKNQVVMAGFRDYSVEKFTSILTDAGYSVVIYIQEKKGNIVTRKLDAVYSPGTYISENSSTTLSNNIISIWFELSKSKEQIVIGCATIDIFTGKSFIFEYDTEFYMNPIIFDQLEKFISEYNPNELIVLHNFQEESMIDIILQFIGTKKIPIHKIQSEKEIKAINCTKQTYLQHILTTFFDKEVYTSCGFYLNQFATQSFCYLLNFIQEHNSDLVRKINLPSFTNTSQKLILANHTLRQLNIINDQDSGHLSSVLSFLNRCSTAMGKRKFKYQILNPTFDIDWLNREYDIIDHIIKNNDLIIRKELQSIRDIEKINRQLISNKLNPSTLYYLYKTIETIDKIYNSYIINDNILSCYLNSIETTDILSFLDSKFIIDDCQGINSMTFDKNIIKSCISLELDELVENHSLLKTKVLAIQSYFNNIIKSKDQEFVKIHETEKSGISLQLTKKRGSILKTILSKINPLIILEIPITDIKIVSSSTLNDEITFGYLNNICKSLLKLEDDIRKTTYKVYMVLLKELETKYYKKIEDIAKYIAKFDVIITKSYISKEYKYCKPEISKNDGKSFVNCQGLRHILVEHLNLKELYVENDINLDEENQGFLLYGTNSAGKTTLIKALGISVIMAQAGLFVPCSKFYFKPYKSIFSRILNNDNIFVGLSTFAVEMSEIRMILKNSDENSLILGDELCSGTESHSASSIFTATLMEIYQRNANFIFATHLHEIGNWEEITNMKRLSMKHLSVKYNIELNKLIYDRKLQNSLGSTSYGIEVAKSLHLESNFIEKAYEIRSRHFPEIAEGDLNYKTSKYNVLKIRGKCEVCFNMSNEVHHKLQQYTADKNGFIGSIHKNNVNNLLNVCEKCHDKIHNKLIT
jgi:DNA mismatch repair protein MutS